MGTQKTRAVFVYHDNPSGSSAFLRNGDYYVVGETRGVFVVADSPYRKICRSKTDRYPHDDKGLDAARILCESFAEGVRAIPSGSFNEKLMKAQFLKGNEKIRQFNENRGRKYANNLDYNIAETVAMAAVVEGDTLYYGGVEDCYVNVLRGQEHKDMQVFNCQMMKAKRYLDSVTESDRLVDLVPPSLKKESKEYLWEWAWCNYVRNNPEAKDDAGQMVGWGCFTGESEVENFIQVRSLKLERGDDVLLFSDGMIPLLSEAEFLEWFLGNVTSTYAFHVEMRERIMKTDSADTEKTLIYWKYVP